MIKPLVDVGIGTNSVSKEKRKILSTNYEVLIMAFFIGLYSKKKKPLGEYVDLKDCGHPLQYLGNLDSVKGRKAYPKLREYIFTALVARTDIDFIALEKGEMTSRKAVDMLMQTMEEYANWGFHFMEDKLTDDPIISIAKLHFWKYFWLSMPLSRKA